MGRAGAGAGRERDRARGRACGTAARWREAAVPLFRDSGRGAQAAVPGKGWDVRSCARFPPPPPPSVLSLRGVRRRRPCWAVLSLRAERRGRVHRGVRSGLAERRAGVGGRMAALRHWVPGPLASRAPRRCLVSSSLSSLAPAELAGGDARSATWPRLGPPAAGPWGAEPLAGPPGRAPAAALPRRGVEGPAEGYLRAFAE